MSFSAAFGRPPAASADLADAWDWDGHIVGRAWDSDARARDYQTRLVGGSAARLARPDAVSALGTPIYVLSDAEARAARRLLEGLDAPVVASNVACVAGRTATLNYLNGQGNPGVGYFTLGNGASVVPAASDTQLAVEGYRQQITLATVVGNYVDLNCTIATGNANASWTEAGIFGSTGASAAGNSGSLFAHALFTYTKTSSVSLTADWFVTIS